MKHATTGKLTCQASIAFVSWIVLVAVISGIAAGWSMRPGFAFEDLAFGSLIIVGLPIVRVVQKLVNGRKQ